MTIQLPFISRRVQARVPRPAQEDSDWDVGLDRERNRIWNACAVFHHASPCGYNGQVFGLEKLGQTEHLALDVCREAPPHHTRSGTLNRGATPDPGKVLFQHADLRAKGRHLVSAAQEHSSD